MKTTKHDSTEERRILTAMIVDQAVLGRLVERWTREGLFRTRWANLVGGWCVRYFAKYAKAPGRDIEGMFESWASKGADDETQSLIDRFLCSLSDEYAELAEESNSEYVVDTAANYFNQVGLERMAELVQGHINSGNVAKAMGVVSDWGRVEMGVGAGIDVLGDKAAIRDAFESQAEPLIKYPGALGRFFGSQLSRDEFVGITAAPGRGKTWWLIDIAWMAALQRRKVAFFEVGDMSQNQIMRRFMSRASGRPCKPPYTFDVPTGIERGDGASADVSYREVGFGGPLRWSDAWKACQRKLRRRDASLLRLSVHPNSSINMDGVVGILNTWERDGWIPDVVAVDYADILLPPTGHQGDTREAINATWKLMRGLSQSRHILVVTATQGDAASYKANTITQGNFSENRQKNDHVTGMFGISATAEEVEKGVRRLNWTKRREEAYSESRCVHVAGCLPIGRPHMKSTF